MALYFYCHSEVQCVLHKVLGIPGQVMEEVRERIETWITNGTANSYIISQDRMISSYCDGRHLLTSLKVQQLQFPERATGVSDR